jgi:hypothetical protein
MKTFLQYYNEKVETKDSSNRRKAQRKKLNKKDDFWKTKREPVVNARTGAETPVRLRQLAVSQSNKTANIAGNAYVPKG